MQVHQLPTLVDSLVRVKSGESAGQTGRVLSMVNEMCGVLLDDETSIKTITTAQLHVLSLAAQSPSSNMATHMASHFAQTHELISREQRHCLVPFSQDVHGAQVRTPLQSSFRDTSTNNIREGSEHLIQEIRSLQGAHAFAMHQLEIRLAQTESTLETALKDSAAAKAEAAAAHGEIRRLRAEVARERGTHTS